ncbi:hypothetical protein DL96DRAFT_1612091 [Flagelloscypha sp. PMI_526]|nr:hypothetical protein DL96DRAFT_1612091 [Flagelloscypha sp. PMI_526]
MDIDATSEAVPEPHPQFFLPNGDLVLHVERTLFKLSKDALCDVSHVIKDLVNEAESASPEIRAEHYEHEGNTKLTLAGDKEREWTEICSLLFGNNNYYRTMLGPLPWRDITKAVDVAAPILRVSFKYKMRNVRLDVIDVLKQLIPSETFAVLMTLNLRNEYFPCDRRTPRQLVLLCHEVNLRRFMPWAYYECARSAAGEIVHFKDLDGETRAAILAGRDIVLQMQRQQIYKSFTFGFLPDTQCETPNGCVMSRDGQAKFDLLLSRGVGPLILIDAERLNDPALCSKCLARAKREVRDGQRRLWDNLPNMFGLENWQALRETD